MSEEKRTIDQLGLSVRAVHSLHRARKHTAEDLLLCTEEDLMEMRGAGKKTVDEILAKIGELTQMREDPQATEDADNAAPDPAGIKDGGMTVRQLGLSVRATNVLIRAGMNTVGDLLLCSEDQIMELRGAGTKTITEILDKIEELRPQAEEGRLQDAHGTAGENDAVSPEDVDIATLICLPRYNGTARHYAEAHDLDLSLIGMDERSLRVLESRGYHKLSDILFLNRHQLLALPGMKPKLAQDVLECRDAWLKLHEAGFRMAIRGEGNGLPPIVLEDDTVCKLILNNYVSTPYAGYSLQDFTEKMSEYADLEQIKRCVGRLLAQGSLEYVDFRCYRVYPPFAEAVSRCEGLNDRNRELILDRLEGKTLQEVGQSYDMTRERVRQIIMKSSDTVRASMVKETGQSLFDEDYYLYFYQTYAFDKKAAAQWFGFSPAVLGYLDLVSDRRGARPLKEALDDQHLSPGLRQRIRNYLNRDSLYLDGRWVPKTRPALEQYAVEHFCRDNVSFSDFALRYNAFLEEQDLPYDEKIYLTESVARSRKNHLADARFLLWKQGEMLRAYDVDGRDYSDLITGLGLDELENIELSTQKFVEEHPELLRQYDIRDQYELHNLLRKILPDGSFHEFKVGRTPNISFGQFDRDSALFDLMINNAPISQKELADLIHREYGYDQGVTIGTYLNHLADFYHQGIYSIDQKAMTAEHQSALLAALDDDFYYIDELKRIYGGLFPGADTEEINPYNLKQMGFTILSRYAFRNHDSLDELFRKMLTGEELLDITELRRRYTYVQAFSAVLTDLKRSLEIIEYEPNKLISMRRLNAAGVFRSDIEDFCDEVYDFVEDGTFFTATSLRRGGFESDLYDLGFSDWFYASLLLSDTRFSCGNAFKAIILYKGKAEVTACSFETALIRDAGSIDVYDLQHDMEDIYGCSVADRLDLVYKVAGSGVFHDKHLDRLYSSEALYWREVDEAEEL